MDFGNQILKNCKNLSLHSQLTELGMQTHTCFSFLKDTAFFNKLAQTPTYQSIDYKYRI